MPITILRYDAGDGPRWARQCENGFRPLSQNYATTGELMAAARAGKLPVHDAGPSIAIDAVKILSPITSNQQLVAQATNYRSHVREIGGDPNAVVANVFFGKAISSITGAYDPIRKPARVQLLDYEVELGLVIGTEICGPETITADRIDDFVGALVIANDVSARDIQVPEGQFYKGKSFRSFTPVGPYLVLLEPGDAEHLMDLELSLWVDGARRQHACLTDMIFKPAQTLTELSAVMDLHAGDLILTGTPGGVALQPPGAMLQKIAALMSPAARNRAFISGQLKRGGYLQAGDTVRATIRTADGRLDLGEQINTVVDA